MSKVFLKKTIFPIIQGTSCFQKSQKMYARIVGSRVPPVPLQLNIETHNYCNSKCIMCGYPKMTRRKGFMNDTLFEKIVRDAAANGVKRISLHSYNEPFIDKKIFEKARFIKGLGMNLFTVTNGSLLTEDLCEQIVDVGFDDICISMEGITADTYESIRVGLSFNTVVQNVKNLVHIRNAKKSNVPKISLNFVLLKTNQKEVDEFVRMWKGIVDFIDINTGSNFYNLNQASKEVLLPPNAHGNTIPCRFLWWLMPIFYDGTVVICCTDHDGKCIVGNLNQESIIDVWRGSALRKIRNFHINGMRKKVDFCKECPIYPFWFTKI